MSILLPSTRFRLCFWIVSRVVFLFCFIYIDVHVYKCLYIPSKTGHSANLSNCKNNIIIWRINIIPLTFIVNININIFLYCNIQIIDTFESKRLVLTHISIWSFSQKRSTSNTLCWNPENPMETCHTANPKLTTLCKLSACMGYG